MFVFQQGGMQTIFNAVASRARNKVSALGFSRSAMERSEQKSQCDLKSLPRFDRLEQTGPKCLVGEDMPQDA
jgi:hypothetical protein